jgi:hypothetical protein
MMESLRAVHRKSGHEGGSPETQKLDRETFKRLGTNRFWLGVWFSFLNNVTILWLT